MVRGPETQFQINYVVAWDPLDVFLQWTCLPHKLKVSIKSKWLFCVLFFSGLAPHLTCFSIKHDSGKNNALLLMVEFVNFWKISKHCKHSLALLGVYWFFVQWIGLFDDAAMECCLGLDLYRLLYKIVTHLYNFIQWFGSNWVMFYEEDICWLSLWTENFTWQQTCW